MARYFDPVNDASHKALLPSMMQSASELDQVAKEAEEDVIDHFTRHGNPSTKAVQANVRAATQVGDSNFYVFLRGYEEDADDVDTTDYPDFKDDMSRTIAEVTRWRMEQKERQELGVEIENDPEGNTRQFDSRFVRYHFPHNWDRRLRKYATPEPQWAL